MAVLNFDAASTEPLADLSEPIPAGEYLAQIVESEMKPTKAGTGEYLRLVWEIVKGQYKGRKLFDNLNVQNPNDEAVRIAKATLSAICRAVGVGKLTDSQQLHGKTVLLKVKIQTSKDTGDLENRIRAYSPKPDGSLPPAAKAAEEPAAKPLPKDDSDPF